MKVIIIEADIGGLTTAIALQQKGIACELYDAAPGNRPLGAGIMLGVNAMRVYDRLGIAEAIKKTAELASGQWPARHVHPGKAPAGVLLDDHLHACWPGNASGKSTRFHPRTVDRFSRLYANRAAAHATPHAYSRRPVRPCAN